MSNSDSCFDCKQMTSTSTGGTGVRFYCNTWKQVIGEYVPGSHRDMEPSPPLSSNTWRWDEGGHCWKFSCLEKK